MPARRPHFGRTGSVLLLEERSMDPAATTTADTFVEDTYITPQFGLIEFLRRVRVDQLSILVPELFGRNMTYARLLLLDHFLIIKPEYIEHVLLTNCVNYRKSQFLRHLLGPLLGNGLLISEGEFWRRLRRIAAPALHNTSRRFEEATSYHGCVGNEARAYSTLALARSALATINERTRKFGAS